MRLYRESLVSRTLAECLFYIHSMLATERSWNERYVGQAWKILERKVHDARKEDGSKYARFFTLVQSSGMGKSRLVDEYSNHHIVIPLCLRGDDETGELSRILWE